MTATPTGGISCFPFAVNCKLTKTFFGVPRKCDHCNKMIVLTAGYACQFCRFRCHKKCTGEGPHPTTRPKLCSLSHLPPGDEQLFNKLLRENEINCNEVDVFTDNWASVLYAHSGSSTASTCSPYPPSSTSDFFTSSRINSIETLTSGEPQSPSGVDDLQLADHQLADHQLADHQLADHHLADHQLEPCSSCSSNLNNNRNSINLRPSNLFPSITEEPGSSAGPRLDEDETTPEASQPPQAQPFVDRIFRLFAWTKSGDSKEEEQCQDINPDDDDQTPRAVDRRALVARSVSPCRTPVDEFNDNFLEEMFQNRRSAASSTSTADPKQTASAHPPATTGGGRLHKQLQWVRYIVGSRCAMSHDCVANVVEPEIRPRHDEETDRLDSVTASDEDVFQFEHRCNTWPVIGLHLNYDDDFNGIDSGIDSVLGSTASTSLRPDVDLPEEGATTSGISFDGENTELGEWGIDWDDLQFLECVWERKYNGYSVHKGRWHGEVVLHKYERRNMNQFMKDTRTLSKIRHENIALFMGASVNPTHMAIVHSVRKGDSLYEAVHMKKRRLSHNSKVNIARQIAQGMGYLHAKGIVVQCLASRNIFLESKVKICLLDDIGVGRCTDRTNGTPQEEDCVQLFPGQLTYVSPELMITLRVEPPNITFFSPYTQQCDVYAYGTVLYEMLSGGYPYAGQPAELIIWSVGNGKREDVESLKCHVSMKSLIEDCWSPDFNYRPSFMAILKELRQMVALNKKHSTSDPESINRLNTNRPHGQRLHAFLHQNNISTYHHHPAARL